jgi:hypothetical protein
MVSRDVKVPPRSGIFYTHQCPFPVLSSTEGVSSHGAHVIAEAWENGGGTPFTSGRCAAGKERRRGAVRSHTAPLSLRFGCQEPPMNEPTDQQMPVTDDDPTAEPLYLPVDIWEQIQAAEEGARRDFFVVE